jgi:hypothetical protein
MRSRDLRSRGRLELAHVWHGREHGRSEQRWVGGCRVTREHAGARPVRGDGRVYRIASDTSGASCSGTVTVLCSGMTEGARLAVDSGGAYDTMTGPVQAAAHGRKRRPARAPRGGPKDG